MAPHGELVGPFPRGVDEDDYDRTRRRVLWSLPSGLYLLGAADGERRNLMTCNLVSQVSLEPKCVGVSVENEALTHELINRSRHFTLSLLRREDRAVVRKFVKPAVDDRAAMTLNDVSYVDASVSAAPIFAGSYAYLDCSLYEQMPFTSHTLFIGEVIDAGFLADENDEILRMEDTRMNYGG